MPVSFAEISRVGALCEIVEMREGLVPDVSLGTHFFNDLVEMQILYLALVPGQGRELRQREPARAGAQPPGRAPSRRKPRWAEAVRVIDPADIPGGRAAAPARRRPAPERHLLLRVLIGGI